MDPLPFEGAILSKKINDLSSYVFFRNGRLILGGNFYGFYCTHFSLDIIRLSFGLPPKAGLLDIRCLLLGA
jgi:hypothetical protein